MKLVEVGDILTNASGIIVHGCNAQGVMGSGLAKQIKEKYPTAFNVYRQAHLETGLFLGDVIFAKINDDLIIANAITQRDYGKVPNHRYVSYGAIKDCFTTITSVAATLKMQVHYPLIGAGLANGDWSIISEIIDDQFSHHYSDLRRTLWIQD